MDLLWVDKNSVRFREYREKFYVVLPMRIKIKICVDNVDKDLMMFSQRI